MGVPVSGLILLPFTLVIFCFSSYLAEWAIFSAVLQGAALVNVGGGFAIGLSPYFFVAALIGLRVVPQYLTGRIRFFAEEPAARHTRVLMIFVLWCAFSAFVLPRLFAGLPVDSPRAGVDRSYYFQLPLQWSFSNAGQAGYMILDFILVLRLLQLSEKRERLDRLLNAFSWSGMFVAAVGIYQVCCNWLGMNFPAWLFNSNEAWTEATTQVIGSGFARVTATFVEPSSAAGFLAAWSVFELSLAIAGGKQNSRHWLCATIGSALLVATASTTGYVTAAVMWMVMMWDCVGTLFRTGVIKTRATVAGLGLGIAASAAVVFMPSASTLLDAVIFDKGMSASALHRTATFGRAIEVFVNSWGLGVGLGSNRSMSAFFYILSNLGLPGIILVSWLLLQLYGQIRAHSTQLHQNRDARIYIWALSAAFAAELFSLAISGAEITQPHLWILWGLLLAAIRYSWLQNGQSCAYPAGLSVPLEAVAD